MTNSLVEHKEKKCGKCKLFFPMNNDYFYNSARSKDTFYHWCKVCDDSVRTERYITKASHHIHRRCKQCNSFFYAELCRVRAGGSIFCNISCKARYQFRGKILAVNNKGSKNPNARLTENDVRAIKTALKDNENMESISNRFNISQSHLYNIKSKRIWKNIE